MRKLIFLCAVFCLSFNQAYGGDSIFDEICAALNQKNNSKALFSLDHDYRARPISGRGYLIRLEKNLLDEVILHLTTTQDKRDNAMVSVIVNIKKDYYQDASKYRTGDCLYFSGTLGGISEINRQVIINNAAISRFHEVLSN